MGIVQWAVRQAFAVTSRSRSQASIGATQCRFVDERRLPWVTMDSLADLQSRLRTFTAAREWDQFHTPKNLAMALCGEAGELIAELQWLADDGIADGLAQGALAERLLGEAADVLLYLIRFTDVCGIHLVQAAQDKIELNESRYPEELARGTAAKYTELNRRREST